MLDSANRYLATLYGAKHKTITMVDVEKVYDRQLLSINADAKTIKGVKTGYLTGIMYLAPASISGVNLCPGSSAGCRASCLFFAGRGAFYSVMRARIVKTLAYLADKPRYITSVKCSIDKLIVKAKNQGLTPVVRLNGTSDITWELNTNIIQSFPDVQFYDYTKIVSRMFLVRPNNYHLTFSLSEDNEHHALTVIERGGVVAAVFSDGLPKEYLGYPVHDADKNDLRFLDKPSSIAGLYPKAKAKKDKTGFSIQLTKRKVA
jgi:hypothetical protein